MTFFKTVSSTLHDHEFYKEIPTFSTKKVIGFYAKLSVLVALLCAFFSAILISPSAVAFVKEAQSDVLATYPAGLEVTVKSGAVSTNAPAEPIVIPANNISKKYFDDADEVGGKLSNVIIIDTRETSAPTAEYFKSLSTKSLLSKNYFVYFGEGNEAVLSPLSHFPDTVINQSNISEWFSKARFLPTIIPVFAFICGFLTSFGTLLPLLFTGLIFLFLQRFLKKDFSWNTSWKICVYASAFPLLLDTVLFFAGVHLKFIFSLLTLIIALVNTKYFPETEHLPGMEA